MMKNANRPVEIFISYSHKDENTYQELMLHLLPLRRQGLANIWSDHDIAPGMQLQEEIDAHLNKAQIILLLVSPAFMASEYCYNVEMKRAMYRSAKGEARVIPIILRPVAWQSAAFSRLQVLPSNGRPITYWHNMDEAIYDVARNIAIIVLELLTFEKSVVHESAYAGKRIGKSPVLVPAPPVRAQVGVPFVTELLAIFTFLGDLGKRLLVGFYNGCAFVSRACGANTLALRASEYAIDLEQDASHLPRLYLYKGWALLNLKRYPEALDAYSAAIRLDPNLSQAYRARGKVYEHLAQQSFDESKRISKEAYEKAEELGKDSNRVNGCAVSPDGRYIVSASSDKTLKVWDITTGDKRLTLSSHKGAVLGCAVSPDGRYIVSASSDRTLKVWDAATGAEQLTLSGHNDAVLGCAVSPDGHIIVSASSDKTLKVWDAATGAERLTLSGHNDAVSGCAMSPDGSLIVSASYDRTLKVWDAATGAERRTLSGHKDAVSSCVVSPNGRFIVSASHDRTLKVWDFATGSAVSTLSGHKDVVSGCAVSSNGRFIVSASFDGTLKVWEAATDAPLTSSERFTLFDRNFQKQ